MDKIILSLKTYVIWILCATLYNELDPLSFSCLLGKKKSSSHSLELRSKVNNKLLKGILDTFLSRFSFIFEILIKKQNFGFN